MCSKRNKLQLGYTLEEEYMWVPELYCKVLDT